jgi:hypothetical protein
VEDSDRWSVEDGFSFLTPSDHVSEIVCTLTADNDCPGEDTRTITLLSCITADLSIEGIEVTQAIQYYHAAEHLTDEQDRGTDNSIKFVTDKPAWVRVYMRSGLPTTFNGGQLHNVDGTLVIDRRVDRIWSNVATLSAINAPYTAEESYPPYPFERNDINTTLNFIIPSNNMSGLLRLTVTASSNDQCAGLSATDNVTIDVNLQQQLQVAALRIGYDGPNLAGTGTETHPAPPLNGAGGNTVAAECDFALTSFPVSSNLNLRGIGVENANAPLITTPLAGGCDPNWFPIVDLVEDHRINDENQAGWIYYGFVTPNIPINHNPCCNTGCAVSIDAAGIIVNGRTFAHEAGHQIGMGHAPCGAVGEVDARYPQYEPYDTGVTTVNPNGDTEWQDASIGEYGLNINNGGIFDPNICVDYMSYCGQRWVSIHSYDYMTNNMALNPVELASGFSSGGVDEPIGAGTGYFETPDDDMPRPLITIRGHVDESGNVSVRNVARMVIRQPPIDGQKTEYVAELIDEDDHAASRVFLYASPQHWHSSTQNRGFKGGMQERGEQVQPPFRFIAVLEDVVEGKTIRIRKDNDIVWQKDRPSQKPELGKINALVDSDLRLKLSWDYSVPAEEQPTVWLRWSNTQGQSWNSLAVGISNDSAELITEDLPAGEIIIQVVSHDGFYSVSMNSPPVVLPDRAPLLSILHPRGSTPVNSKLPLRLLGSVSIRSMNVLSNEEYIWYINDKEVGRGTDIWVNNPGRGEHQIKFVANDPAGKAAISTNIMVK